jgi:hypothetical protein
MSVFMDAGIRRHDRKSLTSGSNYDAWRCAGAAAGAAAAAAGVAAAAAAPPVARARIMLSK